MDTHSTCRDTIAIQPSYLRSLLPTLSAPSLAACSVAPTIRCFVAIPLCPPFHPPSSKLRLSRYLRPRHPRTLEPKQIRPHLTHLHLLAPLRNAIPSEMPPDMLKRLVPTIPVPTMHLDGAVRRLRTQPISIVVTHADFVAHLALDRHPGGLAGRLAARGDGVHLGGGAQDQ